MNLKHTLARVKIEKLYQGAMDYRDSHSSFSGSAMLEAIYQRQYMRAYMLTHDVAQFAWETRLYREITRQGERFGARFSIGESARA